MYLEKAHVKVIGTKYGNGPKAKDLAKFLENLQEDQGHRYCGDVICNITIDTTQDG